MRIFSREVHCNLLRYSQNELPDDMKVNFLISQTFYCQTAKLPPNWAVRAIPCLNKAIQKLSPPSIEQHSTDNGDNLF